MPLLEDLRHHVAPTWLWDAARGRIVWANAAGIAAFDCDTLFDLIDRPFDMKEPGVESVVGLSQRLAQGESEATELMFPSTGSSETFKSMVYLHPLADGRAGVLVVVDAPPQPIVEEALPEPAAAPDSFAALLEAMPHGAGICDSDFRILQSNRVMQNSFGPAASGSLASLYGSAERFEKAASRLLQNAVTSGIETLDSFNGPRDFRVTLSKMETGDGRMLLLLEDVTERRKLERRLSVLAETLPEPETRGAPVFTSPAQVMAEIGRQLSNSLNGEKAHVVAPAKPVTPPAPSADGTDIPEPIRQTLEQSAAAIAICQQGRPVYITQKALDLFGFDTRGAAAADAALWSALKDVKPGGQHLLDLPNGTRVAASRMPMPWQNGRAEQFTFHAATPAVVPKVELPKIEPVPAIFETATTTAPVAAAPQGLQDELQAILDVVSDGIVTLSADGQILSFSAGAEAIFGVRASEAIGRPLAELLAAESRKVWRDYLRSLAGPGLGAVFNDGREMLAQHQQGGQLPLFISVGRVQTAHSKAAYCAVVRDISPWKKTERDLTEAKDKAEQANRRKSDFLAHISHELRTPLNAIMGFSDVMRTERLGAIGNHKYLAYANDIHASGSHLLAIVNDILDLARVEAGKLELNFTAVNLEDVADYVLRLTRETASAANVIVRRSFPQGLPRVVGDLRSLRQVLLNLVSNAIKFTDAGGEVLISAQLGNSGTLALRVKDTGVGMTKSELEAALKPFGRVEDAARPRPGTGLGLPLTKSLVEANRAQLDLHSEPGRGTLAEVTFPGPRVLVE